MGGDSLGGVRLCVSRYAGYLSECWGIGEMIVGVSSCGGVGRSGAVVWGRCRSGGVLVEDGRW